MGLKTLEWHEQKNNGWVARTVETYFEGRSNPMTFRYAHVNIHPFHIPRREGKVLVEFQTRNNHDKSWHDSIDAGKLYVEAIFALDN
jgi:hypothetical protein